MSENDFETTGKKEGNPLRRSLSSRLLALTILFVLLAEIVVMIPSVAKHRIDWLNARIEAAYLVGLALDAPGQERIGPETAQMLFSTANILGVTIGHDGARMPVMAPTAELSEVSHYVDLRAGMATRKIAAAWSTVFSTGDATIRVVGEAQYAPGSMVDIFVSQAALRRDLLIYSRNILLLSLVISTLTAGLVYWSLNRMIVRPVKRLTRNMAAFESNPEDARNLLKPSARADEIGAAERSLAAMEGRIQSLLSERKRLAALGAGISKISHDLRNILASAQLMSDRLAKSDDPRVRKLSPRLISALDRAITLSRDTLNFARMDAKNLDKSALKLHDQVEEVFEDAAAMEVRFENNVPENLIVIADKTQLYRALSNLVRNSVDALLSERDAKENNAAPVNAPSIDVAAGFVRIDATNADGVLRIEIADNGRGVPDIAREHLFEPFKGSFKPGGSGLGAAIAHEIAKAHGGELVLEKTSADGSVFVLTLPAPSPPTNAQATPEHASRQEPAPSPAPSKGDAIA